MTTKVKAALCNIPVILLLLAFYLYCPHITGEAAADTRSILIELGYALVLWTAALLLLRLSQLLTCLRKSKRLDMESDAAHYERQFGERAKYDPRSTKV